MTLDVLINRFISATLLKEDWNHINHIRVALYYAFKEKNEYKAISQVKCGLIIYASRINPFYGCDSRYHETKTVFWVKEIKKFITQNPGKRLKTLDKLILKSEMISKDYILKHYSEEVLDSDIARAMYLHPTKF